MDHGLTSGRAVTALQEEASPAGPNENAPRLLLVGAPGGKGGKTLG